MRLPELKTIRRKTEDVSVFGGVNRQAVQNAGEFADERGLSSDAYPAVTLQSPRFEAGELDSGDAFIFHCRGLVMLVPQEDGFDRLYYRGEEIPAWRERGLSRFSDVGELSRISAASIGAYLLFAPYRAWFNVETGDCGSMTAGLTVGGAHPGSAFFHVLYDDLAGPASLIEGSPGDQPPAPSDVTLEGTAFTDGERVYRFYSRSGEWREVTQMVYRFFFNGTEPVPLTVTANSEASVTGLRYRYYGPGPDFQTEVRSTEILTGRVKTGEVSSFGGFDFIDFIGAPDVDLLRAFWHRYISEEKAGVEVVDFGILGECPDMSFICAADNRIWGCGADGSEIYACALGDPRKWYSYGTSAGDPWAATVGDGSQWTGAVTYRGRPCFFKSDRLFRINGKKPSNFGYTVFSMQGACSPSAFAVVSDKLFYVGSDVVYVWTGGLADRVSDKIGGDWRGAVGAGFRGKYYVWRGGDGGELAVYDVKRGVWHIENDCRWRAACSFGDGLSSGEELYYTSVKDGVCRLCCFTGDGGFTPLPSPDWFLETGELMRGPGKKYLSRVELTISLEVGAACTLYVAYDGSGEMAPVRVFDRAACLRGPVAFTPRRCSSFRLRLSGSGGFKLYGISCITEEAKEYG